MKLYSARRVNWLRQLPSEQAIQPMCLLQGDLQRQSLSDKLLQLFTYVMVGTDLCLISQARGILHHVVQTASSQSVQ